LTDAALRSRLAAKCRQYVLNNFSPGNIAKRTLDSYSESLRKN
jgi:glycosyltransferase involved in cell wall biosynthesis